MFPLDKLKEEIEIYKQSEFTSEVTEVDLDALYSAYRTIISADNPEVILNYINSFDDLGILSPLTLNEDEFKIGDIDWINKRYSDVIMNHDDIEYKQAWKPYVKHYYDVTTNREIDWLGRAIDVSYFYPVKLYISRGGSVNGEHISNVYLKKHIVDRHSFIPFEPIQIPCSMIIKTSVEDYFVVDHREPALKRLKNLYDINVTIDNFKCDIRKFEKLNKNGRR